MLVRPEGARLSSLLLRQEREGARGFCLQLRTARGAYGEK